MPTETLSTNESAIQHNPQQTPRGVTLQRLMQTLNGFAPGIMIDAGIELGIFDALSSGPLTSGEVAERCRLSVRGTRRVLDALASLDWLKKSDGRYTLVPESATFLVKTSPAFLGGIVRQHLHRMLPVWQQLESVMRTGAPAKSLDGEQEGSTYFRDFVPALFSLNHAAGRVLAKTLLAERGDRPIRVLDVGAGSGVFGIAFAAETPRVTVTAADWKEVLSVTRQIAREWKVEKQFSFAEGDLFESDFGSGFDVAVLGNILHMEGEERCRELLRKVYGALSAGGTVAIFEFVPEDDRSGPAMPLIFSITMLLHTAQGDTYTLRELSQWLAEAGFRNIRRLETPSPCPAILADKPADEHRL
jgi:ubiquinone/menaquinone biosynthesis C-methylase UbiE